MNWITPAELSERRKQTQIKPHKKRIKTSRSRGIHFDARRKKWVAQAYINGQVIFIDRYDNETEAAQARDEYIHARC